MEILTRRELEVRLKTSKDAITEWKKQGMPYFSLPISSGKGGINRQSARFVLEEVIAWMKARTKEGGKR